LPSTKSVILSNLLLLLKPFLLVGLHSIHRYEEQYVRILVEKITVYDEHFIVKFKSSIDIKIDV
jgi:hypothetical protein